MTTRVIVSISVGFGLFIAFIAGVISFAIVSNGLIDPGPAFQSESNRKIDWGIIRPRQVDPAGESIESKEAALNAEYGPVNKAALQESKQCGLTRSRNRRVSEQTVVATYQPHRYTLVNPEYRPIRIDYPSAPVVRPVVNPVPRPVSPAIDPATCVDGTCELRKSNIAASSFPTLYFE